jgi:DNA/RNA endonuclease YhcR with UshA esterase domain
VYQLKNSFEGNRGLPRLLTGDSAREPPSPKFLTPLLTGVSVMLRFLPRRSIQTMKAVLSICMIVAATFVWAAETPAPLPPAAAVVKGEVLEVKDVESYTYLRLKTKDGETWAAIGKAPVSKGAKVTIENVTVMTNFESKSLKKTFPTILFGTLVGAGGSAPGAGNDMVAAHSGVAKTADTGDIHVAKATGANARTVAEIMTKGTELKDKPVLVRAKVVKYNPGIMGKNWIHLRDGSGSAADNTNDVLATTTNPAKTGDVVTVKGVVRTNKDFGSGYSYKVLIEEATLQQ